MDLKFSNKDQQIVKKFFNFFEDHIIFVFIGKFKGIV